MSTVSIRDLARNASSVIDEVARSGRPALVTKHGSPVVAVVPIGEMDIEAAVEDLILAKSADYAEDLAKANTELAAGKTRPAADVYAELGL